MHTQEPTGSRASRHNAGSHLIHGSPNERRRVTVRMGPRWIVNRIAASHPLLCELRLREALKRTFPDRLRGLAVPGAQVSLAVGDRPVHTCCFGFARSDTRDPVNPRTRWRAGSISKPVSAIVTACLAARNRLDLDDCLLPDELPPGVPSNLLVTVRQLLAHRAGLRTTYSPQLSLDTLLATNQLAIRGEYGTGFIPEFTHAPDASSVYSGGGYMLLQNHLERRFGDFAALAREVLFDPLGIRTSTFHPAAQRDPLLVGHDAQGRPMDPVWSPCTAASGLVTTSADLAAIFVQVLRCARGKTSPLGIPAHLAAEILNPAAHGASFTLGLHLHHGTDANALGHGGFLPGLRSAVTLIPRIMVVAVGITNSESGFEVLRNFGGLAHELAAAHT